MDETSAPAPKRRKQEAGSLEVEAAEVVTLDGLLQKDVSTRVNEFVQLGIELNMKLLYPASETTRFPNVSFPDNWEELVEAASEVITAKIEKRFAEPENGDGDDSSVESDNLYETAVEEQMTGGREGEKLNMLHFLKMVRTCVPILAYGFHVEGANQEFCFCPCERSTEAGTVAGRCRHLCGMNQVLSEQICNRKGEIQSGPGAYIDHIKEKKKSCEFHNIMYEFLAELYSSFEGPHKNLFKT